MRKILELNKVQKAYDGAVIVDDISFITPVDIISISKLSSSGASLYGARGANGVILIQTR